MITVSNGGSNVCIGTDPSELMAIGTVDGVPILEREGG